MSLAIRLLPWHYAMFAMQVSQVFLCRHRRPYCIFSYTGILKLIKGTVVLQYPAIKTNGIRTIKREREKGVGQSQDVLGKIIN